MNSKRRRASTTSFREKDLSEINTENFLEFLDLKCLLENFKTQRTFYRFSRPKIPPESLWDIKDLYEFFRTWKIIQSSSEHLRPFRGLPYPQNLLEVSQTQNTLQRSSGHKIPSRWLPSSETLLEVLSIQNDLFWLKFDLKCPLENIRTQMRFSKHRGRYFGRLQNTNVPHRRTTIFLEVFWAQNPVSRFCRHIIPFSH